MCLHSGVGPAKHLVSQVCRVCNIRVLLVLPNRLRPSASSVFSSRFLFFFIFRPTDSIPCTSYGLNPSSRRRVISSYRRCSFGLGGGVAAFPLPCMLAKAAAQRVPFVVSIFAGAFPGQENPDDELLVVLVLGTHPPLFILLFSLTVLCWVQQRLSTFCPLIPSPFPFSGIYSL